jgi:hypothetical protein
VSVYLATLTGSNSEKSRSARITWGRKAHRGINDNCGCQWAKLALSVLPTNNQSSDEFAPDVLLWLASSAQFVDESEPALWYEPCVTQLRHQNLEFDTADKIAREVRAEMSYKRHTDRPASLKA